ncbi:MAG: hypothetical protein ABJF23_25385 [Bryobacteraceae bacterium]
MKQIRLLWLLLAPFYAIGLFAPVVGGFLDDGNYVATARSLAEGHGYRISTLPGEMPQTKYPFLLPGALAAVWRVFPAFPANTVALKLVPMVFALLWGWTIWLVFRDELGRTGAGWLAALVLALPWIVFLSSSLLSETLFAFLTWAALYRFSRRDIAMAAALAGAAFLTRTSGVALAIAALLILVKAREWKQCALFAATFAAFGLPWVLWQAAHTAPADPLLAYYSKANYAQWNLLANFDAAQKTAILWRNLLRTVYSPAAFAGFPAQPVAALFTLPLCIFGLRGWWLACRKHLGIVPVWAALYYLLLLSWAWPAERFFFVLVPLLFYYAWTALPLRPALWLALAFSLCGSGLVMQSRDTLRGGMASLQEMGHEDWRALTAMLAEFGRRVPPDAVLAGNLDPLYSLYSGRKAIRPYAEDPYLLYFSDDPVRQPLGGLTQLRQTLRQHRVSFLIVDHLRLFQESKFLNLLVDEWKRVQPEALALQAQTADGRFQIYQILRLDPAELP